MCCTIIFIRGAMFITRYILSFLAILMMFGMSDATVAKQAYALEIKDINLAKPPSFNVKNTKTDADTFITPLCNIIKAVQGPWGKAILIIGAVFVGVNVFIGKFSFTMLIGFVAAGALILSPQVLLKVISGTGTVVPCP